MILFAFDLDGTLISWKNSWDEIRRRYGIRSLYYDYLRGDLTFSEMKKLEIQVWRRAGVKKEEIEEIANDMEYNPGAYEVIEDLKELGPVGIISAAPDIMVRKAAEELEVNFWCASHILFDSSGRVRGFSLPLAMPHDKAERLDYFCYRYSIPISNSVAVGDSEIDKWMLKKAGLGIAFNCDNGLEMFADVIIDGKDLRKIKSLIERKFSGEI